MVSVKLTRSPTVVWQLLSNRHRDEVRLVLNCQNNATPADEFERIEGGVGVAWSPGVEQGSHRHVRDVLAKTTAILRRRRFLAFSKRPAGISG